MRGLTVAAAMWLGFTTMAAADDMPAGGKACIFKSAEMLPRIPGLEIKGSKAAPVPSSEMIKVDLDILAAGQSGTYSYLCTVGKQGAVVLQQLMN